MIMTIIIIIVGLCQVHAAYGKDIPNVTQTPDGLLQRC